jgi:transcription elongation factor Elf1
MFEDIIGEVETKEDLVGVICVGDGILTCPVCGSTTVFKGPPLYLLHKNTSRERCDCKRCKTEWYLTFDAATQQYIHIEIIKKP